MTNYIVFHNNRIFACSPQHRCRSHIKRNVQQYFRMLEFSKDELTLLLNDFWVTSIAWPFVDMMEWQVCFLCNYPFFNGELLYNLSKICFFPLFQPASLERFLFYYNFQFLLNHNSFALLLAMISILYCLKIRMFPNLPIFQWNQGVIILQFILLIAIIYSRGENKKKNCWNNGSWVSGLESHQKSWVQNPTFRMCQENPITLWTVGLLNPLICTLRMEILSNTKNLFGVW